jgi:hypothetical protein
VLGTKADLRDAGDMASDLARALAAVDMDAVDWQQLGEAALVCVATGSTKLGEA